MSNSQFDEFKSRFEAGGKDPEIVVKLFVEAMLQLERDRDLGVQMMAVLMSKRTLGAAPGTLSGFTIPRTNEAPKRILRDPHIARSLAGGSHQNDYRDFDPQNLRIELDRSYSSGSQGIDYPAPGRAKFFVKCGGADHSRPISLARNRAGYWKVVEFSSLTVGVRKPAGDEGDF